MSNESKYSKLELKALQELLSKKYQEIGMLINNQFNLERKKNELNSDISELRREISRKNQNAKDKQWAMQKNFKCNLKKPFL